MKNYKLFFFAILLVSIFSFSVSAQPKKNAVAQLNAVFACFETNEAAVASTAGGKLTGNDDTLKRLNESLPFMQKLVDCADRGTKIVGLPLKTKRALVARKTEYSSAKEVFTTQQCIFSKLDEMEKGIPAVTKKISDANKTEARANAETIEASALQAKLCAEGGISSKTIPNGMKTGFVENLKKVNSLLAQIEDLKKSIETMPD